MRTIETEVKVHLATVRNDLYEDFDKRTSDYIALQSSKSGFLEKELETKFSQSTLFFNLIDTEYVGKLRETLDLVIQLFEKSELKYRLYDIHFCLHSYHRLVFIWTNHDRDEIFFDFMFDSDTFDPFSSFYKLGMFNSCGELLNGDILHGTIQLFEHDAKLPNWFVNALSKNS
jgi:hypothetical protein